MDQELKNSLKAVTVPNRLNDNQIIAAFQSTWKRGLDNININIDEVAYSPKYVFQYLQEKFATLPIHTLFEHAGFFNNAFTPTDYMVDQLFAFQLSDLIDFAKSEKRDKSLYFITKRGLQFLEAALNNLRADINEQIFYLS